MQNSVISLNKQRRDRGRILTETGWQKILNAINIRFPEGYIVQDLSDLTDPAIYPKSRCSVSVDTVSKILKRSEGVDKKGIESLFMAFGLKLEADDHASSKVLGSNPARSLVENQEVVATPAALNSNFVGREGAFAELHTKIGQGAKVIVIQAPGGVGKTTLAQEFLSSLGFEVGLELLMAKEEANITPVESVVEEWLKRDFDEEPGRDFGVMLGRLKRQLQTKRAAILIMENQLELGGKSSSSP